MKRKALFRELPMRQIIKDRHILNGIIPPELASEFFPIRIIGKGESGVVIEAQTRDKKSVAIKCVLENHNFKSRELQILKTNDSPLLLRLITSFYRESSGFQYINYVTELMPMTLRKFMSGHQPPNEPMAPILIKLFAFQIFAGLCSLHKRGIMHRDINMDNILVDPLLGRLKIADFGCSKYYNSNDESVPYLVERPYRAPELICGYKQYGAPIDIWAAGCIYAELLKGSPLFTGSSQASVLYSIMRIIGPPKKKIFEYNFSNFENMIIPKTASSSLADEIPNATEDEIKFLKKIFNYDPRSRPSGRKCMEAHCFDELFNGISTLPNHTPLPVLDRGGYTHLKHIEF